MPIEVGIWKLGGQPQKIPFESIESELKLEDTLARDLSILSPGLMLIGRQVLTAQGKFIDILAMDAEGNLSVIELKKNQTPRDAVAQLLDYASWVQTLAYEGISELYSHHHNGEEFEKGFAEYFGSNPPEELNRKLALILVAAKLDNSSERIIDYLASNFSVPINAVFFRYFKDGENEYLSRSWLIDPQESETTPVRGKSRKGQEVWNGQDFYVSYGPPESRDWEDARRYGFVSGGGGKWYVQTLYQLFPGARVFATFPRGDTLESAG